MPLRHQARDLDVPLKGDVPTVALRPPVDFTRPRFTKPEIRYRGTIADLAFEVARWDLVERERMAVIPGADAVWQVVQMAGYVGARTSIATGATAREAIDRAMEASRRLHDAGGDSA
jgi:hypothetical protein